MNNLQPIYINFLAVFFFTRGRIIRLDELGPTFVVRLVMRLQYKDGHKTRSQSGRTVLGNYASWTTHFERFKSKINKHNFSYLQVEPSLKQQQQKNHLHRDYNEFVYSALTNVITVFDRSFTTTLPLATYWLESKKIAK